LITKKPISSGIVSVVPVKSNLKDVYNALLRKNIVCGIFEYDNVLRFCFSGFEPHEQITELMEHIDEVL
ncbi:hypothetical protein KKF86_00755, partial [bacterium]|nr:hypothetical protein [bacterium]